jgi:SAM-dependent methyltransferase
MDGSPPPLIVGLPAAGAIGKSSRVDCGRWDEKYAGIEFQPTLPPSGFVAAELTGLRPGRALDLAAGHGRHAVWLAEQGWQVTAVDFSRVGLDKARKLSATRGVDDGRVDWVVADLDDYQPTRDAFDLVLMAYFQVGAVLRNKVLAEAAAALVPGGTLLVVGHDLTNLTEGVGGPRYPEVLYTPEEITAGLRSLRIVRAGRVRRPVQHDGVPATAIDTLVRAERT